MTLRFPGTTSLPPARVQLSGHCTGSARAGLQSPRESSVPRLLVSLQDLSAGVQADEGKWSEHVKLSPSTPPGSLTSGWLLQLTVIWAFATCSSLPAARELSPSQTILERKGASGRQMPVFLDRCGLERTHYKNSRIQSCRANDTWGVRG